MNEKKISDKPEAYTHTTLNYLKNNIIIDKKMTFKEILPKNNLNKREFGNNLVNVSLTVAERGDTKSNRFFNKGGLSFKLGQNQRERSREKSINNKAKIIDISHRPLVQQILKKVYGLGNQTNNYLSRSFLVNDRKDEKNDNKEKLLNKNVSIDEGIFINKNDISNFDNTTKIQNNLIHKNMTHEKDTQKNLCGIKIITSVINLNEHLQENQNKKILNAEINIGKKENEQKQYLISDKNEVLSISELNIQYVTEYQDEIFSHLISLEDRIRIDPEYMMRQLDISEKMREILIDWLVDVHLKFKLLSETLFLTVMIIDRYLQRVQISREQLQLVGISSLLIACKYEEIYPPELKSFVYITDNAYKKEDVLNMERNILETLDYDITYPTPLRFMEILCLKLNYFNDKVKQYKMLYILELTLNRLNFYKYTFIELVISAEVIVSNEHDALDKFRGVEMICNKSNKIKKILNLFFSSFEQIQVEKISQCIDELSTLVKNMYENRCSFKSVKQKYSLEKYCSVSETQFF